jgi:hypothetical protein
MFRDRVGDNSSGILMMIIVFVAAVIIANVGVIIGADIGQLSILVGAFLVGAAGGQIGQALQGKPSETPLVDALLPMEGKPKIMIPPQLGVLQNTNGRTDQGRMLKLLAIVVALELAILILFVRGGESLVTVAEFCGVFIGYATASEITQKMAKI